MASKAPVGVLGETCKDCPVDTVERNHAPLEMAPKARKSRAIGSCLPYQLFGWILFFNSSTLMNHVCNLEVGIH